VAKHTLNHGKVQGLNPTAATSTIKEKMLKKVSYSDFEIELNSVEKTLPVVVVQWQSDET
jgi:hypothetical protein